MPPRSLGSACALIGLCSLTAIEAGGCSERMQGLASLTRSGLPMLSAAVRQSHERLSSDLTGAATVNPLGKDAAAVQTTLPTSEGLIGTSLLGNYELSELTGLSHLCGRYELRQDGRLVVWDAFASTDAADGLASRLARQARGADTANEPGHWHFSRQLARRPGWFDVTNVASAAITPQCRSRLAADARAVLVAAREL